MKKLLATMICGGMLLAGGAAFADDMSKDAMAKHDQMMKDCMAKQDTSMSKDDAMKACKDKMMKKDSMGKDSMSKDNMGHDEMSKPK
jgi:pentapeptide MXKDX repeat protein